MPEWEFLTSALEKKNLDAYMVPFLKNEPICGPTHTSLENKYTSEHTVTLPNFLWWRWRRGMVNAKGGGGYERPGRGEFECRELWKPQADWAWNQPTIKARTTAKHLLHLARRFKITSCINKMWLIYIYIYIEHERPSSQVFVSCRSWSKEYWSNV